jgi:hypothetical protein
MTGDKRIATALMHAFRLRAALRDGRSLSEMEHRQLTDAISVLDELPIEMLLDAMDANRPLIASTFR